MNQWQEHDKALKELRAYRAETSRLYDRAFRNGRNATGIERRLLNQRFDRQRWMQDRVHELARKACQHDALSRPEEDLDERP